jgi:O-antigen ligase/tetratricopeptide (TPR) repeat protein
LRLSVAQGLRAGMEVLVLAMVGLSPWAFGAVEPVFEYALDAGVALVLLLWGLRVLVEWKFSWKRCPVSLCLAGLFLVGVWQLVPLPREALARLSPATAGLYDRLLPAQGEVFPGGEPREAVRPPAGSTISVYPTATRQELARLLAVVLLFAAVRNNIASRAAFWRFSMVAAANGALLALFALIQFFTSPHHVLYWTWPSAGQVFGPFICRNHFPYYVNVCLGLGAGLLIRPGAGGRAGFRSPSLPETSNGWQRTRLACGNALSELLAEPWALWAVLGLAVMLAGVAFSLSRGGLLALLGGVFVCLAIRRVGAARSSGIRYVLLALVLALILGVWFGLGSVENRLATLWQGNNLNDSRLSLWSRVWPLAGEYLLWGTGYGTFLYVEPLTRTSPTQVGLVYDHAHNDYLEVLIEGGLVGLALALAALGLIFWLGYRAWNRHQGSRAAGLALGGLFGLTTVAIHSAGDFGLHVPAIAVLVTVLGAHLCGLGTGRRPDRRGVTSPVPDGGEYTLRLGGLAPVLAATAVVVLGLVIYSEGWKADLVHRFQMAAIQADAAPGEKGQDRALEYLQAGARLAPEYAGLQAELGIAHLTRFEGGMHRLEAHVQFEEAVQLLAAGAPAGLGGMAQAARLSTSGWLASATLRQGAVREEDRLREEHLVPALRHLVRARDLCPLLCEPHVRIAAHREVLDEADTRAAYLGRAKLLMSPNAELWYLCGLQELLDGDTDQATRSWHRCLELSDRYLPRILGMITSSLSPQDVLERLLPEKPELLVMAANQLYPGEGLAEEGRPYLEKALVLLQGRPGLPSADDVYTAAVVHRLLDQPAQACQAYQAALERKPNQVRWRLEFAQLLNQEGFLKEAQRELLTVLAQEPGHGEANQLLKVVRQRIAAGR